MIKKVFICIASSGFLLFSCTSKKSDVDKDFYFTSVPSSQTNIHFNNQLIENDSANFLTNQYIYIGSGVAAADFNNDGLQDLFFAGEQVSSKLYINKGDFKFEDITKKAGISTTEWCTGVSIVDINSDGLMDIYVCASHAANPAQRKNMLFINQGNLMFKDEAAAYGLDNNGFSTQAAFFDYDKDGDLDMYLMNHNVFQNQPNNIVMQNAAGTSVAADKLFRNEGVQNGSDHPVFKDVSAEAGINDNGYGLGLCISDVNQDGWPDIYVANDFLSNDILWINDHNGHFINRINRSLHHQSYNSMGTDIADFNNDLLPDIAVLDMQPETNYRKKTMFAGTNPERYDMEQNIPNYQPQFTRNMLQLNHGNRISDTSDAPFFSEIAQLAGVWQTDWSWSVLMADFDNDGWKDIQITNGLAKDLTNNDFLFFRTSRYKNPVEEDKPLESSAESLRKDLDSYGSIKINNYFFHNNRDLTFTNTTKLTGTDVPSISHGAVYADLDNDGDLDMVMNNMNQEAFVWKNELRKTLKDSSHNFLSVRLLGTPFNPTGVGARLNLYAGNNKQVLEQNTIRGYMSSVDNRLHFGLDSLTSIDSLQIVWPDNKMQVLKNIKVNQLLVVKYSDASVEYRPEKTIAPVFFTDLTKEWQDVYKHDEVSFYDFGVQRLLPQKYSQLGPPLVTGDLNGDGLEDFFIGGASFQSGLIFLQNTKGDFTRKPLVEKNKNSEDLGAVFIDVDADKDLDLIITEGSSEFGNSTTLNIPRLYKNDGKANFTLDETAFPSNVSAIAKAICIGDYDNDGDMDIFIGGRVLASNLYPLSPHSYILQNNNGKFKDVTDEVCAALVKPGLITDALWTDFDNDQQVDLVICGEWMPVRFFKNTNGKLNEITQRTGLEHMNGMWRSLKGIDLDNDGDIDFVAGNMGLNNKYHVSAEHPSMLYVKDIDGNGSVDLIPAYYIKNDNGKYDLYPGIDRTEFADQVLAIKKKYLLNADYAKATMSDLVKSIGEKDLLQNKCETMASVWIENIGNGHFKSHTFPIPAQFAPVNSIVATDVDGDGQVDLLLAGNEYQSDIGTGRYDASYGQFLKNNGNGSFTSPSILHTGFFIEGDVKNMQLVETAKGKLLMAAVNDSWIRCLKFNK